MQARLAGIMILLVLLCCGGGDRFDVRVTFPEGGRELTSLLRVMVLIPGEEAACQALQEGSARPDDPGYDIEDQAEFALEESNGGQTLDVLEKGPRLFYAEAEDESTMVILRGCTPVEAGGRGSREVVIELAWVENPCLTDADCNDENGCTTDRCEQGQCVSEPLEDGTACDDGLYCTDDDQCTSVVCSGTDRDCSGESAECITGVCNEELDQCEGQPVADGQQCNDGLYCNVSESCTGGVCGGGQDRDCSASGGSCVDGVCDEDADACVGDPLPAGTGCDDEINCTENDVCDGSGTCQGTPIDCSALSDQCNLGVCTEATGQCGRQAINEGMACDDGVYCNVGEACASGVCTGGQPRDCGASGGECTTGVCDEGVGACVGDPLPAGTGCSDGNNCTENDACDGAGTCQGTPVDCSALSNQCNLGVCNLADGQCVRQPANQGQTCEDGNPCTLNDTCQTGTCTAGPDKDCSSLDDDCNVGTCDPADGSCYQQPSNQGGPCSDSDACTVGDTCDAGGQCVPGSDPKDTDNDTYIDRACGGSDCNDSDPDVHPGVVESPATPSLCQDGVDNDCDGATDADDSTCPPYHRQITIDATQVAGTSDLPDFPVLIAITADPDLMTIANGGHVAHAQGYDITFQDADGTTPLDHEIEGYDGAAGTLVAWVRVPLLAASSDTVIFIQYGDSSISAPTENPAGVWDANFAGVWHLREDPSGAAPQFTDSTVNALHGTNHGGLLADDLIAGKIGGAIEFDHDPDDWIEVPQALNITGTAVTAEAWVYSPDWSIGSDSAVINTGGEVNTERLFVGVDTAGPLCIRVTTDVAHYRTDQGPVPVGEWAHIAMTYDGSTHKGYVNGVEVQSWAASGNILATTVPGRIGARFDTRVFSGRIDEVRVSAFTRPAEWIQTEYNNQNSPATFYSIGAEF